MRNFCSVSSRYSNVAASIAPSLLYSASPTCRSPCCTLKRKKRLLSRCPLQRAANLPAVFSVSVAISAKVFERNFHTFSSIGFIPGFPVPIETKHLTSGFNSAVSGHQMFEASPSTSSTGLFAPSAPSTNVRAPITTGSKKRVAADVAKAASLMVGGSGSRVHQ